MNSVFSAVAVFSVIYLVILVIAFRILSPYTEIITNPKNPFVPFNLSPDIFLAFPIIIYAQNCHILAYPIMKELHNPTIKRMEWSTRIATAVYGSIYVTVGIVGYLSFYGQTEGKQFCFDVKKTF
jgi:amino acid permease